MATRWRPDTCNCELEFTDGNNLEGTCKFLKKCNIHALDSMATVIEENRGKNRAVAKLMEATGLEPHSIRFEFERKGRGRRLCKLTVPVGTPNIEVDEIDKVHTIILRK